MKLKTTDLISYAKTMDFYFEDKKGNGIVIQKFVSYDDRLGDDQNEEVLEGKEYYDKLTDDEVVEIEDIISEKIRS